MKLNRSAVGAPGIAMMKASASATAQYATAGSARSARAATTADAMETEGSPGSDEF